MAPILAYFIDSNCHLLFGIIPSYWPLEFFWTVRNNQANSWIYLLVGFVCQFVVQATSTAALRPGHVQVISLAFRTQYSILMLEYEKFSWIGILNWRITKNVYESSKFY